MGFLRDWTFIEEATRIPALSELVREALIRAVFVRDDRVLPRDIIADLSHAPAVTVKVKDDVEVRKLVQVLNGQESTATLGLNAEDFHFFRQRLSVGKGEIAGIATRPRLLLTYDWLVPERQGVQLDVSAYNRVEWPDGGPRAIAQVGAPWKALYDDAVARGHHVPFVPAVPLDFAIGDAIWGEAPFASYEADFGAYVLGIRAISGYGHRARIGFDEVSIEGTGYDLLHGILGLADEYVVPLEIALRLEARSPAQRTLTYAFEDAGKLAEGLAKLARSGRSPAWIHVVDAAAASLLRPGTPADPFRVQAVLRGTEAGMPAKEKAIDAALAGFKAKASDVPNPFDVPADEYRKTSERIARQLFVGGVRVPVKALGEFRAKLQTIGEQNAAKPAMFAILQSSGMATAFPCFDAPKDRTRIYELSRGLGQLAKQIPRAVFVSRLARLWYEKPDYVRRTSILRQLKLWVDAAHVAQPLLRA